MNEAIEIIKTNIPVVNDASNNASELFNVSESSNVNESVITENIDFSAMSKREILDFCSNSPFYLGQFAKLFCRNINDDITTFLNQNKNIKEAFVHVFFDEETEEFKYLIDLQEDSYPNTLCIKLTLEEIDTSKPKVSILTEEKSPKVESN